MAFAASRPGAALELERGGGELLCSQLCTAGSGRGFFKMGWDQALQPPKPSLLAPAASPVGSVFSSLLEML